jgi:hypothetical protein
MSPTADAEVECSACGVEYAYLGDHGQCIQLHGRCLACLIEQMDKIAVRDMIPAAEAERILDTMVEGVVRAREAEEQRLGRRIFPCALHVQDGVCPYCQGRTWVVGYPPGFGNLAPA